MKISLVRISTKDLATLTGRIIEASKNGKNRVSEPNPLLTEVEKHYAEYDVVYTKQTFSGKGKSVAAADEERDSVFNKLRNFLWGYRQIATMPNADLRKLPSASAIRKNLEKSLRAYLDFLSVMQNQPHWNALYLEVSELVKAARK